MSYSTLYDTADYERFSRLDYSEDDIERWAEQVERRVDALMEQEGGNMSVMVADKGGGGNPPPAGVHLGVCSRVWDLGEQEGFQGKLQHKVVIVWELDSRIQEGEYAGKRHLHMQTYTASLNEKARLRQDLEAWRGKAFTPEQLQGFDLELLIGVMCQMNLVEYTKQNGGTGVKMASIMPPPAGAARMEPELDADYMPGWVKAALGKDEGDASKDDTFDDDVPF